MPLVLFSRILDEQIVCLDTHEVPPSGETRVCYTRREVEKLHAEGASSDEIRQLHALKKAFPGAYLGRSPGKVIPVAPQPAAPPATVPAADFDFSCPF